jgi:hypothetical protein
LDGHGLAKRGTRPRVRGVVPGRVLGVFPAIGCRPGSGQDGSFGHPFSVRVFLGDQGSRRDSGRGPFYCSVGTIPHWVEDGRAACDFEQHDLNNSYGHFKGIGDYILQGRAFNGLR